MTAFATKAFLMACATLLLNACDSGREDEFGISDKPPDMRVGFFEAQTTGAVFSRLGGFARPYEMGSGAYAVLLTDTASTTRFLIVADVLQPAPGLYSIVALDKRDSISVAAILLYTGERFENIIEADEGSVRYFQGTGSDLIGRFSLIFSKPIPEFGTGTGPVHITGSFHTAP